MISYTFIQIRSILCQV